MAYTCCRKEVCSTETFSLISDDQNNVHNLGSYTQNPVYDNVTDTLQITFSRGDNCRDHDRKKSIVQFICKPGMIKDEKMVTFIINYR